MQSSFSGPFYFHKALTRRTMPQVSQQPGRFNTHTVLVFLCGRAVVLAALLQHNGTHSGSSEQWAERNHGPGQWLPPLPFIISPTHMYGPHMISYPFMWSSGFQNELSNTQQKKSKGKQVAQLSFQ